LPSSADSAFCRLVVRSTTVPIPSESTIAESAVRPGAISYDVTSASPYISC
jgi:hypothetical protein